MFGSNKFYQVVCGFVAFGFTLLQGLDWLFKKYNLDSKWFNYILIALFLAFLTSIVYLSIKSKKVGSNKPKTNNKKAKYSKFVIKAFQRRFRSKIINGKIDNECLEIAKNLIKRGLN